MADKSEFKKDPFGYVQKRGGAPRMILAPVAKGIEKIRGARKAVGEMISRHMPSKPTQAGRPEKLYKAPPEQVARYEARTRAKERSAKHP